MHLATLRGSDKVGDSMRGRFGVVQLRQELRCARVGA
jgi:hypothetical protein